MVDRCRRTARGNINRHRPINNKMLLMLIIIHMIDYRNTRASRVNFILNIFFCRQKKRERNLKSKIKMLFRIHVNDRVSIDLWAACASSHFRIRDQFFETKTKVNWNKKFHTIGVVDFWQNARTNKMKIIHFAAIERWKKSDVFSTTRFQLLNYLLFSFRFVLKIFATSSNYSVVFCLRAALVFGFDLMSKCLGSWAQRNN